MSDVAERLAAALQDRYTVQRELGSGGMATVYLAQDLKHRRQVAIKVLRPELAATLGVERFVREIEIAANLTHPHILTLIDSGEADGFLYYVMPFVEGESLRDRLLRDHIRQHFTAGRRPAVPSSAAAGGAAGAMMIEDCRLQSADWRCTDKLIICILHSSGYD